MKLSDILEIFKDISVTHPMIKSFHTGMRSEHNASNIVYPALRVVFPYDAVLSPDNRTISYTFTLTMLVKDVLVSNGTYSKFENTNYNSQDSTLDESTGRLVDENLMRCRGLGIASQVLETLKEQEDRYDYFQIESSKIKGLDRTANDFVTGASLTFTIKTDNDYRCEYPNLLG